MDPGILGQRGNFNRDGYGRRNVAAALASAATRSRRTSSRPRPDLELIVRTAEQDRLLKYFYELPFIGMAIISPETRRWLRFNNQLCEMLGYSREELAEKDLADMTYPADMKKDIADLERVLRGESEGYATNKRFLRKDGSIVMANMDVKCVHRNNGEVHYVVTMIRDVTEQERQKAEILAAQSQLQATLDAIPDLLFLSFRTHLPARFSC